MKKTKKRSARERRILILALLVAGAIVAGSTFAWFTSQDEVTNRLSASAEYGVSIAEDFQPPETWVPGQEINKDVSAVNTGNVDAFVRMWLDGNMRLLQQNKAATADAQWDDDGTTNNAFETALTGKQTVTDSNISAMGLTEYKTVGTTTYYFKTLDKTQTKNPGTNASTNAYGFGAAGDGAYSEVQAMQGSRLAYAPAGASYAFVLKEETKLPYVQVDEKVGTETVQDDALVEVTVPAGTLVIVNAASKVSSTITDGVFAPAAAATITSSSGTEYTSTGTVYVGRDLPILTNIEYESFSPFTDGLYLFLRNEDNVNVTDPEFSGYYVKGLTPANKNSSAGTYYALNTNTGGSNRSDYTVKGAAAPSTNAPVEVTIVDGVITAVAPTTNLELFTASYVAVASTDLKWYTNDDGTVIYAAYDKGTGATFDSNTDIVVVINLANIGTTAEMWTVMGVPTTGLTTEYLENEAKKDGSKLTYYYNNDVEAGDSTVKLVDKVTLYSGVTNKAYLAFDFDLNVHLESIQVTMDENGKELATAVAPWEANGSVNTGATGARDDGQDSTNEIASVSWSAS